MSRAYRAPTANGAVLAEPSFDAVPALVRANRERLDSASVIIGGLTLRDLRAEARHGVLELASWPSPLAGEGGQSAQQPDRVRGEAPSIDREGSPLTRSEHVPTTLSRKGRGQEESPLLLAGHQPELAHPGVWAKNFALNGLARRLGGVPLNLIVDNDTLKSTSLRFPAFRAGEPDSVRLESVPFDAFGGETPYEDRAVADAGLFRSFPTRAAELWANWGYEPLLAKHWTCAENVGEAFTAMRREREREWGCENHELPVSRLAQTTAFRRFASHILSDLPRFREAYNAAIRAYRKANGVRSANHPAPELAPGEAPFWVRGAGGRRARATPTSDVTALRPRALTLTLFARVCLGDLFIHGIGGGKYDEVTDAIIRNYFGVEAPAYQVVSATLFLPLPPFPSTATDLTAAERRVRDLRWNPHRGSASADELLTLAAQEPPHADHAARRTWFRELQRVKERLRARVADQVPDAEASVRRVRTEVDANAVLQRRDYAWVLYPEDVLKPFLQELMR